MLRPRRRRRRLRVICLRRRRRQRRRRRRRLLLWRRRLLLPIFILRSSLIGIIFSQTNRLRLILRQSRMFVHENIFWNNSMQTLFVQVLEEQGPVGSSLLISDRAAAASSGGSIVFKFSHSVDFFSSARI